MQHSDIIFRAVELKDPGLNRETNRWRTGFFQRVDGISAIVEGGRMIPVDDKTLGMSSFYKALKKCSDEEENIFEGDILELSSGERLAVVFDDGAFRLADKFQYTCLVNDVHPFLNDYDELPTLNSFMLSDAPVIAGNVYENLELL